MDIGLEGDSWRFLIEGALWDLLASHCLGYYCSITITRFPAIFVKTAVVFAIRAPCTFMKGVVFQESRMRWHQAILLCGAEIRSARDYGIP